MAAANKQTAYRQRRSKPSRRATRFAPLKRFSKRTILALVSLVIVASSVAGSLHYANAQSVQSEIDRLNRENANNQRIVNQLASQSVSYQDAIKKAQAEVILLQGAIAHNREKQAQLQARILINQYGLDSQKALLGESVKSIYVRGQISPIEMLATSRTIGDYIDAETYRTAVQLKIQRSVEAISRLQLSLSRQKAQAEAVIAESQRQTEYLQGLQKQQAQLISYNAQQQRDYNARTAGNRAKIALLISGQLSVNNNIAPGSYYFLRFPGSVRTFDPNMYPYKNAGFGMSYGGCSDNDGPDRWGYCTRQCVSYAAWAVEASGRDAPKFYGSARDWVAAARRDNVPITTNSPKVGDVAISTAGGWGHAMYVEQVDGNRMLVSQYNRMMDGRFSVEWRTFSD